MQDKTTSSKQRHSSELVLPHIITAASISRPILDFDTMFYLLALIVFSVQALCQIVPTQAADNYTWYSKPPEPCSRDKS